MSELLVLSDKNRLLVAWVNRFGNSNHQNRMLHRKYLYMLIPEWKRTASPSKVGFASMPALLVLLNQVTINEMDNESGYIRKISGSGNIHSSL